MPTATISDRASRPQLISASSKPTAMTLPSNSAQTTSAPLLISNPTMMTTATISDRASRPQLMSVLSNPLISSSTTLASLTTAPALEEPSMVSPATNSPTVLLTMVLPSGEEFHLEV